MGGMIARYYLKQEIGRQRKARLCITLGSPHHGILGLFSAFHDLVFALTKSFLPSKLELVKDFSPKGRMKEINEMIMAEDLYTTTMVNIMGSLSKYGGTDGLFRPKPVHDMVNKTLSSGHFMLHKNDASYQIIQDFLTNQVKVIKLRLLYIEVPEDRKGREKEFFFIISHEKKQWQRYPSSGYIRVKDLFWDDLSIRQGSDIDYGVGKRYASRYGDSGSRGEYPTQYQEGCWQRYTYRTKR
jgi:hypothetical protein